MHDMDSTTVNSVGDVLGERRGNFMRAEFDGGKDIFDGDLSFVHQRTQSSEQALLLYPRNSSSTLHTSSSDS